MLDIFLEGGADEGLRRANGFAVVRAPPSPSGFTNLGGALRKALLAVAALAKKYGYVVRWPRSGGVGAERRTLRLPTMSGAVTDGIEWQLFTFKVGPNGVGGTYQRSIPVDADWSPATRAVLTGALKDLVRVQDPDETYRAILTSRPAPTGSADPKCVSDDQSARSCCRYASCATCLIDWLHPPVDR